MEMETGPSSRKGLCGHPPKGWKHSGQREGEVYSLPRGAQNAIDDSRAYCSVALTGKEQGESSCTVLLAGVLTSNPKRGQAQKA